MEIQVDDLRFRYPTGDFELAVDRLRVASGARVAVVGPSGLGKTTLLGLLAGIVAPAAGSICVGGRRLDCLSDAERRRFRVAHVGLVFQELELLEYLDARDNVLLPYRVNRALKRDRAAEARADSLLDRLGLRSVARRGPAQLSQGERQRVAAARALIARPGLVLADEPTGNLDEDNKRRLVSLLLDEARALNATAMVVTHDRSCLGAFDRVIDLAEAARAPGSPQ